MRDNDWTGLYSTGDYENLLEIARYLHPEPFCIKHVPAAAVIESDLGLIYMFAVNGRPTSTPAHIEQYMPGNLARLIQQIPDDAPERIPLLTGVGMADPDNPLSCRTSAICPAVQRALKDLTMLFRQSRQSQSFGTLIRGFRRCALERCQNM
jgi:hypothetical protein